MQRELVERARSGDEDAFRALAGIAGDRVYAIATLILRDRAAVEDAVQEVLIRVWRDLPQLRDVDRFDAWLRRLCVNACTDAWRAARRQPVALRLLPSHDRGLEDPASALPERDALERAFRRLSIEHRTVIVMRHYVGLSLPEVAGAAGIPLGTAKSRLHHAERSLRAELEADARVAQRGGRPA